MRHDLLALLLSLTAITSAHAAVVIDVSEVGGDVVFSYTGSINTDSTSSGPAPLNANLANFGNDGTGSYFQAVTGTVDVYQLGGFTASPAFGGAGTVGAHAGDSFLIDAYGTLNQIYLPSGYVSGSALSGSLTFTGTDMATLGLNPGSYLWTWSHNSVGDSATFNVVPETASLSLLALGGLALLRRRR